MVWQHNDESPWSGRGILQTVISVKLALSEGYSERAEPLLDAHRE